MGIFFKEKKRIEQMKISEQEKEKKLLELMANLNAQISSMQSTISNMKNNAPRGKGGCLIQ